VTGGATAKNINGPPQMDYLDDTSTIMIIQLRIELETPQMKKVFIVLHDIWVHPILAVLLFFGTLVIHFRVTIGLKS
jgi:hypothetical protein